MAKETDDLTFTFNTEPFKKGLEKLGNMVGGIKNTAVSVAEGVKKGLTAIVSKLAIVGLAIRGIKNNFSEIGKVTGIVKDIFMKNFLFPLRKAIYPYLQKILDWVRDNRTAFVRWGQILVNIFNVVISAVKTVINLGKKLAEGFFGFFNRVFGTQIKGLTELLNILTFKFAVALEFLKAMIAPIAEKLSPIFSGIVEKVGSIFQTIADVVGALLTGNKEGNSLVTIFTSLAEMAGKIVEFVLAISDGFIKGIAPYVKDLMTPLQKIVDAFKSIFNTIFGSNEAMKGWRDLFQFIGDVIGKTLLAAFNLIAEYIKNMADGLNAIKKLLDDSGFIKFMQDVFGGTDKKTGEKKMTPFDVPSILLQGIADLLVGGGKKKGSQVKNAFVKDAIIKPGGQVIHTDPSDTIIATKNNPSLTVPGGSRGGGVTVNFHGMTFILEKGSKEEMKQVSVNLVEQFRNVLNFELERSGKL